MSAIAISANTVIPIWSLQLANRKTHKEMRYIVLIFKEKNDLKYWMIKEIRT